MKKLILLILFPGLIASCNLLDAPDQPEDAHALPLRVGLEKRVVQDNEFALELFKKILSESSESNVLVSPLSVSIALGMTWNGATGETKAGMESTLKMSGLTRDDINDYFKTMQTNLPLIDPTTKLGIANSVWYRTAFPVRNEFITTARQYFDAEIRELDFSQPWAVDTINGWISRKTDKHITEMLDQIPGDAVMYLVNAIYFKGIWRKPFDKKNTREMQFTNQYGKQMDVNMMYQKDTFEMATDDNAQYLNMTYGNKAFEMTVILPQYDKTTDDVIKNLTVENMNNTLANMQRDEIELYFPRFKSKSKFLLNDVLSGMGMSRAFEDRDEFREMADASIFISRVLHDTSIEITEEGTVAAAATVVEMREKMNRSFMLNRPFLYIIREKSTGVILFAGKISSPTKY